MKNLKLVIIGVLISISSYGNITHLFKDLTYPDVALAIHKYETGHGKSTLCLRYNNLFGMKASSRKKHYGTTKQGYAKYSTIDDSILDYLGYEKMIIKKYRIKTRKQYIAHIAKKYSKESSAKYKKNIYQLM